MDLFDFSSLLLAQPGGGAEGGQSGPVTLITFGLIFAVFYLLIIRPQSKRQKETKAMLSRIKKGDKVVTIGGIRGVVKTLTEEIVVLKVGGDATIEFSRSAVAKIVSADATAPATRSASAAKTGAKSSDSTKSATTSKSTKK